LRYLLEYNTKNARDDKIHYRAWQKMVAEKWLNLTEEAKKPYLDAANADNLKYKQELAKWELKMVRLGNIDLVREEALIDHDRISKPRMRRQTKSSDSD
jgi:HMG (high mobility group) box